MTPRDLLAAFDVLAEAPGGTQRLRALVLELAVRGKLVPQDPRDEPATALLERIATEKARLVKQGKLRASKPLPPVSKDEVPFEVPAGWLLCRMADACDIVSGVTKGRKLEDRQTGIYPYLRVANVQAGYLNLSVIKEIAIPVDELDGYRLMPGDVLLTEGGDWDKLGRSAIWNGEIKNCIHQNHVFRARCLHPGLTSRWVSMFTNSPDGRDYFQSCSKQTTNLASINMAQLRNCPLPVPPTAEQRRIVARVDELMAVLDRLEAARGARDTARVGLRDAALAALRNAPDAAAVEVAWARVAELMDELFTTPADVAPLRQTILQLAVRGRLVPQDRRDEPAQAVLGPRKLEPAEDEKPFDLPAGWAWSCMGRLGEFVSGGTPSKSNPGYWNGDIPWVSPKDMKVTWLKDSQDHVSKLALEETAVRLVRKGSVLMVVRGMILAHSFPVATNLSDVTINQDMKALLLFRSEWVPFLVLLLKGTRDRILQLVERSTHGTCKMPFQKLSLLPLALPPLAEQQRIVAKVDGLMALCDQLEARLRAVQDTQEAFAAAAVHHLDT